MSQFMLLIYAPAQGGPTPEEMQAEMPKWFAYGQALEDAGAWVAGNALQPTAAARTVRVRGGARQVTDGPFAETAEILTGYYIIEAADIAAAEDWAAKIPSAPYGSVEVRPVMVFPDAEPSATDQAGAKA
jgi:hypothetical protein